jgi:hypothetical protein
MSPIKLICELVASFQPAWVLPVAHPLWSLRAQDRREGEQTEAVGFLGEWGA